MWKCPKCGFTSRNYQVMMKHYYSKHHVKKAGTKKGGKGAEKKRYVFHPLKR